MRYFECLTHRLRSFSLGVIYPENSLGDLESKSYFKVASWVDGNKLQWQEVTEADYLAQQDFLDEFDRHVEGGMKAIQNNQTLGDAFDSMDKSVSDFGITKIAKPINEYHDALDAIGQGRIKEIPKHLFDAILAELVEEDKRRWAVENGFVEG